LEKKTVLLKLFRFDPGIDKTPAYEFYELPYEENTTVLDLLEYIYKYKEPFSFQRECKSFKCGSCGVNVNGLPILACREKVKDRKGPDTMVIEPLTCFPLIKDLLVDFSCDLQDRGTKRPFPEFWDNGERFKVELEKRDWEILREYSLCIRCGACMEICSAFEENKGKFSGPLYLLDVARLFFDPRDKADRLLEAVTEGLAFCNACKKCNEVCPMRLDVFKMAVERLKERMKQEIQVEGREDR
jgi:succinate dehydrogenase/fumarate reductase iron-sulfur protein